MLILTRKDGQRIILKTSDGTVEIVLYNLRQGSAAIGIDAPHLLKSAPLRYSPQNSRKVFSVPSSLKK
jgi:hypothetical protein